MLLLQDGTSLLDLEPVGHLILVLLHLRLNLPSEAIFNG
jgi:hypothetical protein